ncbi:MAG: calcium/sodium antiporter [Salinivirgaceae bacterium]|jgi:cation:H+ antiporter|nr:calcium/sodium antiporter [Salinivirgaceae bacterium]
MNDILFLVLGFVALFLSGKYLVTGSVQIARLFKIPTLVVGLTIVSFGTSAPELLVSLKAALSGHPDISIGNVVGSNISNMALVLGITALIFPIPVSKKIIRFDWPVLMIICLLFYGLALNGILEWWEGLIFVIAIVGFNVHSISKGRKPTEDDEEIPAVEMKWHWALAIILASCIGLVFGADWLVKGASGLARSFGVGERIISVSIIAFGTSVPELATSVVAALKKETDISIGNIVGSNIFNVAGILGITSLVTPIPVNEKILSSDVIWMLAITILLFVLLIGKRKQLTRWKGAVLILSYSLYIYILLNSGT